MLGAIIGDMVGSKYEFHPNKSKEFNIYDSSMRMTDDSYCTICVANVLLKHFPIKYDKESLLKIEDDLCKEFVKMWSENKHAGFGGFFYHWCEKSYNEGKRQPPYNSYGNGSAMRVSPVGWIAKTEEEVKILSKTVSEITHNHPEGIKGAEAVAMSIFLSSHGATKEEIKERMIKDYYPEIKNFDFNNLIRTYGFSPTCQESVPQAIYCFLISNDLEDAIRNCVAIGGDCDTTAAMAGSIAEAFYQKGKLSKFEEDFLYYMIDPTVENLIREFHKTIGSKKGQAKHVERIVSNYKKSI